MIEWIKVKSEVLRSMEKYHLDFYKQKSSFCIEKLSINTKF